MLAYKHIQHAHRLQMIRGKMLLQEDCNQRAISTAPFFFFLVMLNRIFSYFSPCTRIQHFHTSVDPFLECLSDSYMFANRPAWVNTAFFKTTFFQASLIPPWIVDIRIFSFYENLMCCITHRHFYILFYGCNNLCLVKSTENKMYPMH